MKIMKKTLIFQPKGYYLFESLADSRNCYFETEEEIDFFRRMLNRYLKNYVELHKMYLSSEGYQLLLKIKTRGILIKKYIGRCLRREKSIRKEFIEEPWRIISEQIRVFHSVYVKWVNKRREREGVLVKHRYKKYYFEGKSELEAYIEEMEKNKKEIINQRNKKYRVRRKYKSGVKWGEIRRIGFVESVIFKGFRTYVVSKLIKTTLSLHSPPP